MFIPPLNGSLAKATQHYLYERLRDPQRGWCVRRLCYWRCLGVRCVLAHSGPKHAGHTSRTRAPRRGATLSTAQILSTLFLCAAARCHVRCYTPRKRLAVQRVKFEALWRLRECIHDVQGLSLNDDTTTDEELAAFLSCCPNVTELSAFGCGYLTFARASISRFPITSLNASGCLAITNESMKEILHCPLTALDVSGCEAVTDNGLKDISRCPLASLNLSWCSITDNSLKEISRCPLTSLNLLCCSTITNRGLKEVSRCPLTSLDLSFVTGITDEGFKEISRCPLTALDLSYCSITNNGLKEISRCPLSALDVSGCKAITNEAVNDFSRYLPHCTVLH